MKKHRPRLTYANVVATLALFLALCGGAAFAASRLPKNSVGSAQLKKGAVTGAKVKKHSLLASSFKAGQAPKGPAGPRGAQGEQGKPGPAGSPWTAGGTLPSGATLKGTFVVMDTASAENERFGAAISFGIPLASQPTQHFIAAGTSAPGVCPGDATTPLAAPGQLCVYESKHVNIDGTLEDPVTGLTGGPTATPYGAGVAGYSKGAGIVFDGGTWAVTAP
jgi:hypothetical protein